VSASLCVCESWEDIRSSYPALEHCDVDVVIILVLLTYLNLVVVCFLLIASATHCYSIIVLRTVTSYHLGTGDYCILVLFNQPLVFMLPREPPNIVANWNSTSLTWVMTVLVLLEWWSCIHLTPKSLPAISCFASVGSISFTLQRAVTSQLLACVNQFGLTM
jgi:hypothetical protein